MSVVHFKFKNSLEYDSVTFDGLAISLSDLKKAVMFKKRMRPSDTDLQVINAQTFEEYKAANVMIPKNTSLTIARIPVAASNKPEMTAQAKAKKWEAFRQETQAAVCSVISLWYSIVNVEELFLKLLIEGVFNVRFRLGVYLKIPSEQLFLTSGQHSPFKLGLLHKDKIWLLEEQFFFAS